MNTDASLTAVVPETQSPPEATPEQIPHLETESKSPRSPKELAREALVKELARNLGETQPPPIHQIRRTIQLLGEDAARALLLRTDEVEAAGGMMLEEFGRRRTRGGVFFQLGQAALVEVAKARQEKRRQRATEARREFLGVIEEVLREATAVLRIAEILERGGARLITKHPDPPGEIANAMTEEIRTLGEASRFERAQGGGYFLRGRSVGPMQPRAAQPSATKSAAKTLAPSATKPASATKSAAKTLAPSATKPASATKSAAKTLTKPAPSAPGARTITTARRTTVVVEVRRRTQ